MLFKKPGELAPIIADAFESYFTQIKDFDIQDATEHTLRPALHNLLITLADQKKVSIKVIPEPKRDESGRGAPDVKFKIGESILGYLENKKIETNLDHILNSKQITKYKKLSDNLIVTNYLEWIWLKDGKVVGRETLAYISDVGHYKALLDPDKAEKVCKLIANFLSSVPKGIDRVENLALALATRCHDLREFMVEELIRQEKEHQEGRLYGLFNVFKKDVFNELNLTGFADAFAQMLGYGLFLARLNNINGKPISLSNAKQYIPTNFGLISELVNFLDELEKPEYSRIKWLIEEILSTMNNLKLDKIIEGLAFTERQGKLFAQTEEERLLFSRDPYIYFYEDFLKIYDSAMRKSRGIYYTPPPVVNFIVRAINDILKDTFSIKDGLADRKRVTVLDFATGTATFLREVIQQIIDIVPNGLRDQMIREHALKNLFGFEYLIAPYTIAHLKLSQFLHEKGYTMQPKERLQIYLTNTLEPITPQMNYLLPALTKEVEHAQAIKEKPILVITGNPPYNRVSQNNGEWINNLIKKYYYIDGVHLKERNAKSLKDDYVKFIRFAEWKMEAVSQGIVGIISNHSFLDNVTCRGMRKSLLDTFNQIYILNLNGNTRSQRTTPDGGKDVNVFDIEQGVSISILVKIPDKPKQVFYSSLWGSRITKYQACMNSSVSQHNWNIINPQAPNYFFTPQKEIGDSDYGKFKAITEIFNVQNTGLITSRDKFVFDYDVTELKRRIELFRDLSLDDVKIKKYALKDVREMKLSKAQTLVKKLVNIEDHIVNCHYRPFDTRKLFYNKALVRWPVYDVMKHLLGKDNIALKRWSGLFEQQKRVFKW